MVTVPFMAPRDMTITAIIAGLMLPWHVPDRLAVRGRPHDEPNQEVVVIATEWPTPYWPSFGADIGRAEHERLHIERCCTDYLLAAGAPLYDRLDRGADPPDFIATMRDGSTTGIDVTQLLTSRRIMAQAQFERIRAAMMRQPRDRIAKLRGHHIYLWFPTDKGIGLPQRAEQEVEDVVNALCIYEPDTSWLETEDGTLASLGHREADIQDTESGCRFYAADFRNAFPATEFYMRTGFELSLAFQTQHAIDDAWVELARLVEQKDKPTIQNLIVTVGGPNRRGLAYPSSQLLFNLALETGLPALAPKHLEEVIVHSWGTGLVVQAYPPRDEAYGPTYGGYAGSHLPMVVDEP
jgi:hypothetical protein